MECVRSATGLAEVDEERRLEDQGLDSAGSIMLRAELSRATLLELPATLVYDYPTAGALAAYIGRELARSAAPPPRAPTRSLRPTGGCRRAPCGRRCAMRTSAPRTCRWWRRTTRAPHSETPSSCAPSRPCTAAR